MPLVDTDFFCRYYFDEAASGVTPTTAQDAGTDNLDLTINFGAGDTDLEWTEVSGNRGLDSKDTAGDQRAQFDINDTSDALRDALTPASAALITIECVVTVDNFADGGGRIWVVNDSTGVSADIGFVSADTATPFDINFYYEGTIMRTFALTGGQRYVLHAVVDTAQATAADRVTIYVDGVDASPTEDANPALDDQFDFGAGRQLIALNRESTGTWARSMDGILYYAAVYDSAFTPANVTTNFDILTADDDTPAAAGLPSYLSMGGVIALP